jgi:hypothetical protein
MMTPIIVERKTYRISPDLPVASALSLDPFGNSENFENDYQNYLLLGGAGINVRLRPFEENRA